MSAFERWLSTVCFQEPPNYAKDLAKDAWNNRQKEIDRLKAEIASMKIVEAMK